MNSCECQSCGSIIHLSDEKCPYCGNINQNYQVPKGSVVKPNYVVQPNYIIRQSETLRKQKGPFNKWITFFLCFFLGIFGVHKFYEGKTCLGILYLFSFGLFGIGVFIDLIISLTRPQEYYL